MKRVIGILLILCSCAVETSDKPDLTPLTTAPTTIGLGAALPTLPTTTSLVPSTTQALSPEALGTAVEQIVEDARSNYGPCGEWRDLALSVGWPESEWPRLGYILYRESRCTPYAWNGADAGLSQINQIHRKWLSDMGWSHPDDMFDPAKNLTFAYRLWTTSGWKPWSFEDDFTPPVVPT
jgi:hypothetical protein